MVGVDPAVCSTPAKHANESLGYASTELIRRLNLELGRLPHTAYNPTILDFLALRVLARRRDKETTARVDRATFDFGLAWNRRVREAIVAAGVDLVGDLDELPMAHGDEEPMIDEDQRPPSDDEILAAATVARKGLRRLITRRARRLREQGVALEIGDGDGVGTGGPGSWSCAPTQSLPLSRTSLRCPGRPSTCTVDSGRKSSGPVDDDLVPEGHLVVEPPHAGEISDVHTAVRGAGVPPRGEVRGVVHRLPTREEHRERHRGVVEL